MRKVDEQKKKKKGEKVVDQENGFEVDLDKYEKYNENSFKKVLYYILGFENVCSELLVRLYFCW